MNLADLYFAQVQKARLQISERILAGCTKPTDCRQTCCICLESMFVGKLCTQFPCDHSFCPLCIARWVYEQIESSTKDDMRRVSCPVCRLPLLNPRRETQQHVLIGMMVEDWTKFIVIGYYAQLDEAGLRRFSLADAASDNVVFRVRHVIGGDDLPWSDDLVYSVALRASDGHLSFHGGFHTLDEARRQCDMLQQSFAHADVIVTQIGMWTCDPDAALA